MDQNTPTRPAATLAFWAYSSIVVGTTVTGLFVLKELLIPLAISGLLFVLIVSVIDRIAAIRIGGRSVPIWLSYVLGFLLIVAGILAILSVLSAQAKEVAAAVPRYQDRFAGILANIVEIIGDDNANAVVNVIQDLDASGFAVETVSSAKTFLSGAFLVLLYLPFMLIERRPMREKLAISANDPELGAEIGRTVIHISESLQRYVGIKTFVSALTGLLCYAIMKSVGLDFAETWGVLTFALNFIPSVIFPAIVALVQFDGYSALLIIVLGCGAVQFVIGNILEPALTGKSLNLSPMMVIVALTTWTTIWGLPGAFLSVPITVCVMIIFAHVPGLRWAAILMSGDGRLSTPDQETASVRPTIGSGDRGQSA